MAEGASCIAPVWSVAGAGAAFSASGETAGLASAGPLLAKVEPCASEAAMVAPSLLKRVVASVADRVQVR